MTPFETALVNIAGVFSITIVLIMWTIKLGAIILITMIIWSLIEDFLEYIKNNKGDK